MKATFSTFAFGCRVNQAEKEALDRELLSLGFVQDESDPAFYVVNSCAITGKAEREVRQHIRHIRRSHPETTIIVTGCAATNWLKTGAPVEGADLVVGNINKETVATLIGSLGAPARRTPQESSYHDKFISSGRYMVKLQDGCNRFCTYCIVPYLRGRPASRTSEEIVTQIRSLGPALREVVLAGINTEYFGVGSGESLTHLLDRIIAETHVPRISFGSIHPWSITPEFLAWYGRNAGQPRLVGFFHIPLQSGSDTILTHMHRGYSVRDMTERLDALAAINPDALIGTDVICGFLGETEKEFGETYRFLERSPIAKFHVFRFSNRQGTAAFAMKKRICEPTPREKSERARRLAELGARKYGAFMRRFIGRTMPVLLLEAVRDGFEEGLLPNQLPVYVKGEKPSPGVIGAVRITGITNGELSGTLA